MRGFAYNSLSPTELVEQPDGSLKEQTTGGRHLFVGSVEVVRDLPRNLAVATFFDFGNAFNDFGDPLEYSAGVGIRYRLPVRVDRPRHRAAAVAERQPTPAHQHLAEAMSRLRKILLVHRRRAAAAAVDSAGVRRDDRIGPQAHCRGR